MDTTPSAIVFFGDGRRLAHSGDFNLDLPIDQLLMGANTISLRAVDVYGSEDLVDVTVTRETGSASLPYTIDWGTVADPQDVGQSVDGSWNHDATGLRTISTGYDRLYLIGIEAQIPERQIVLATETLGDHPGSRSVRTDFPDVVAVVQQD